MDWDAAYNNEIGLPADVPDYYTVWARDAAAFRARLLTESRARLSIAYGPHRRQRVDLFLPQAKPRGLAVFVHGGYWQILDGSYWSHFSAGALAHDYAVAIPTYRLCPDARIADIAADVAAAIDCAADGIDGPIHLSGHSAGGQLVARLATTTSPLPPAICARLSNIVPISGLHDLRPLMLTRMNRALKIDDAEAERESPALLRPIQGVRVTTWVGANERPELIRQSQLLAKSWAQSGATIHLDAGRHHFDVIDGLKDPNDLLTLALIGT